MNAKTLRSEESQTRGRQYDARQECARQLRLMGFSLRQFLTVPYFIQLLISTVLGSVILQALGARGGAELRGSLRRPDPGVDPRGYCGHVVGLHRVCGHYQF